MAVTSRRARPAVRPEALGKHSHSPRLTRSSPGALAASRSERRSPARSHSARRRSPSRSRSRKRRFWSPRRPGSRASSARSGRSRRAPARRPARTSWPRSPDGASPARSRSTAPSFSGPTTTACSCSRSVTASPSDTSSSRPRRSEASSIGRRSSSRTDASTSRAGAQSVQVQRVARQHRGRDPVHPGVGRDAPVHLGDAPLLRPPARLLHRRQAARQRPAASVRRLRAARSRSSRRPVGLRALADGRHERRRGRADDREPDDRHAGARDRRPSLLGRKGPRHPARRARVA